MQPDRRFRNWSKPLALRAHANRGARIATAADGRAAALPKRLPFT